MHTSLVRFRERLSLQPVVVGACVGITDSIVSNIMGHAGCDFLWIDMEHSGNDKQAVLGHILAAHASDTAAFVRVPWNDPILIKPILEMGPDGVIFPMIRSAEEAERAVRSTRYPPAGTRSFGPVRANSYGLQPAGEYREQAENGFYRILQIEHIDGVNDIDNICQIDGVDCILFGPMDLSASMGQLGVTDNDAFVAAIDRTAAAAKKYGKTLGCCVGYSQQAVEFYLDRGIRVFASGMDSNFLATYTKDLVDEVKRYAQSKTPIV